MNKHVYQALFLLLICCTWVTESMGQNSARPKVTYRAFLSFQAYGLPLQNSSASFQNAGAGIGVDVGLNARRNLLQSVTVGYQSHQQHEENYYINTQFIYRPLLLRKLEPSVGMGVGYMLSVANKQNPFYEQENGSWDKSRQTKGHWQVPISFALGYRIKTTQALITPFIGYDIVPIINYNAAFLVLPYSTVSIGTRISFVKP